MSKKDPVSGKIGVLVATIIGFNAMVGAGVLLMPAMLSSAVGPAGVFTLIFSVVLVLSMGLSLGRAAEIFPGAGWSYLYPSKWAGHIVGLISAFLYIGGLLVAMGVLVQQAGIWTNKIIPMVPAEPLGIYILLFLMLMVVAGAKTSSWWQYIIAFFVVTALLATGFFGWINFKPSLLVPFMPKGFISIFSAGPALLFSFLGFESAVSLYSIVKNPSKNVPKAITSAVILVGILYFLFVFGVLYSVPASYFSEGINVPLVDVLKSVYPNYEFLGFFVIIGAIFAIVGTIHSVLWGVSELLTDVLKRTKSKIIQTALEKRFWNNKVSTLVCTTVMFLSAVLATGEKLVSLTVFFVVPSYTLSVLALLFEKEEWKNRRNYITLVAVFAGSLMIYFAGRNALGIVLEFFGK